MRIAAIYNVWDGIEILRHSVRCMRPLVDEIIIVYSRMSNRQEYSPEFNEEEFKDFVLVNREPVYRNNPSESERDKRNTGLDIAREMGFTHFIMMDCDEFYDPIEFNVEKARMERDDLNGLVCGCQVYFGSPELTIGMDPSTRVTFIQKITPRLRFRINKGFPYAYDANGPRIDPTRQLSHNKGVEWSEIIMHHYSWVRKDIMKKINNSSARLKENPQVLKDYLNAKEGYLCQMYNRKLIKCENKFNITL